ncbi:MAG: HYR domain-containing protein [Bacteroidales bacterium]|nr:HYR domain-containing protein [Bacteroidales bacterium]
MTVTVADNELPVIICPANIIQNTDLNLCEAIVNNIEPIDVSDNCSIANITYRLEGATIGAGMNDASGLVFNQDETTVWYIITDASGNKDSCSFKVTIEDHQPPDITCPGPVIYSGTDDGVNTAVINGLAPVTSDNCGSVILQTWSMSGATTGSSPGTGINDISGTTFNLDTTWGEYYIEDDHGNSTTCQFKVIVTDDENPLITCPADVSISNDPRFCSASVEDLTPVTWDNNLIALQTWSMTGATTESSPLTGLNDVSGEQFNIGVTTVAYHVEDDEGNSADCSFTITVTDDEDPGVVVQDITIYLDEQTGEVTISADSIDAGSTDNCAIDTMYLDKYVFYCSDIGENEVVLTVEDIYGNQASQTATVTVEYETIPSVTLSMPTDTICSGNDFSILVSSTIDSTKYTWTVVPHPDILGESDGQNDTATFLLTQNLVNTSTVPVRLEYTLSPKFYSLCMLPDTIIYIWVEPSPTVDAGPEMDTICDGASSNITLSTITNPIYPLEFRWRAWTDKANVIAGVPTGWTEGLTETSAIGYILDNKTDTAQLVFFEIVPYTVNGAGNERCAGDSDTVRVWVEPKTWVDATPESDTLCDGEQISITLSSASSPVFPVEFRWRAWAEDADSVETLPVDWIYGLSADDTIKYLFDNVSNSAQRVFFEVVSYTTDGTGIEKCAGSGDTVEVWVEPTTWVDARPETDTLCSGELTNISLNSNSLPLYPVEFRWKAWAENAGTVQNMPVNWQDDLLVNDLIEYQLINTSDDVQRVFFEVVSYTVNAAGIEKCTGLSDTVEVWVEPAVNMDAWPELDTICSADATEIFLSTTSSPHFPVEFRWRAWAENAGTIEDIPPGWQDGLTVNDTIKHKLTNSSDAAQLVYFEIVSYTVNGAGIERCSGQSDTVRVWVEPLTTVDATPESDTLCDGDLTRILLSSPSIPTFPVRFRWRAWAENIGSVEVLPVGWIDGLSVDDTIQYPLDNMSNSAQRVFFEIVSYTIDGAGIEKCTGRTDTVEVWVEPSPMVDAGPEEQIICDEDFAVISISSPSLPIYPVRFRWIAWSENPGAVEELPGSWQEGLNVSSTINHQLENLTDTVQRVFFLIQPYTVNSAGQLKCTGEADTVIVWVEPTTNIDAKPEFQLICDETITNISLSSTSAPMYPVEFRWRAWAENAGSIDVLPAGWTEDLTTDSLIEYPLNNLSLSAQRVFFLIESYSVTSLGAIRCIGESDTVEVWVDPTPLVNLSRSASDTVFCSGLATHVQINGPSSGYYGDRFRYTILADPQVEIQYSTATFDLEKGHQIIDTLINHSGNVQQIALIVTPYTIDEAGLEKCIGINDTLYYDLTPGILLRDSARTFVYDTLQIRCYNDSSGFIYLNSLGGITAYAQYDFFDLDYFFDGSEVFEDTIGGLRTGSYHIEVLDFSGCYADTIITLNQPDSLWSDLMASDDLVCENELVTLEVVPHGGTYNGSATNGYTVEWDEDHIGTYQGSPPYPNPLIGTSTGVYWWNVTDLNNCVTTGADTILSGNIPITRFSPRVYYGAYSIHCNGYDDGQLIVNARNIYKDITYELFDEDWNLVEASPITDYAIYFFDSLSPGNYYIQVTGIEEGCVSVDSTTLIEPDEISIADTSVSRAQNGFNLACFYSEDGWIQVDEVTGGHGLYSYTWIREGEIIPGETDELLSDANHGNYEVIVNDQYGCLGDLGVQLTSPDTLKLSIISATQVNCFGDSTGMLEVSGQGGTGNISIDWPDLGTSGPILQNLPAGWVTYTATDEVSCFVYDSLELIQGDEISISPLIADYHGYEIRCFEGNDGWIEVTTEGGLGNHYYAWNDEENNDLGSTGRIENLDAGWYYLSVTDDSSCVVYDTILLEQPTLLEYDTLSTSTKVCQNYGSIESAPSGGVPIEGAEQPYILEWSNGSTGMSLEDLLPDTYYVTLTDWNNCSAFDSVIIREESPMEIEVYIYDSIQCKGFTNGSLSVHADHATDPLDFSWDDGTSDAAIYTNIGTGLHWVQIIDSNECVSYDTLLVPEPEYIQSDIFVQDALCFDSSDALIELGAVGGNGGYSYIWNNALIEGDIVEGQSAGDHELIILDRKNCELTETVHVGEPDPILVEAIETRHPECDFSFDGEILAEASGGTPGYTYSWTDLGSIGAYNNEFAYDLGPGNVTVIVTDNHNCTLEFSFNLESISESCLDIPTAFSPNNDGVNERWIILNLSDENRERKISDIYPELLIEVYDRAGQKRWVSDRGYDTIEEGWDGSDMFGTKLPMGSYYYFVHLGPSSDKVYQGIVTIIY